jgi:hypothetical protein
MFDDDRVTAALSALSPYRRAVVAALAARRAAGAADLPGADAYFDDYVPGYTLLVSDAAELLAELTTGSEAGPAAVQVMRERLEALLGPEGEEEEEPAEIVPALLFNAALILDLALRAWAEPERSDHWAFTTLSEGYAFAYQLDQSRHQKPGPSSEDAEVARQLADLEAVAGLGEPLTAAEFAALEDESGELSTLIRTKFRTIATAVEETPQRHLYAHSYVAPIRVMMYRDALATKGMPGRTLLFAAAEPDRDGPQVIDGHRLLAIGTGGVQDRTGRYCIDCDSGWIYFVDGAMSRSTRVAGMPSTFSDMLEAFDRIVADTTGDEGPDAAGQLTETIKKIDPTVERFETAFWDSAASAVASGAYAQQ